MYFGNARSQARARIQKRPGRLKILPLARGWGASKEASWMGAADPLFLFFFTSFPHLSVWQRGGE